ncbi:MAG: hypothetical protein J0G98_14800 [Terrimonas ferruginea]|jgi:hypothetical protein|uniref:hypothetical protein n=1 Tax=Terrimonas ferruginea TaxID=249 RepID=UPI00092C72AE|nr:hypothetical protein [Terrimonas ferruginea]MBN8784324.1 hypothetical protein [Terrimonas ferruginea]OJW45763.1 MAG: hypothetical protein BGO56_00915 [Sphingobacteriales bacterium 48-107]
MKRPALFILLMVFAMVSSVLVTSVISKVLYLAADKELPRSNETVWEKTAPSQPVMHGMTVQR